MMWLYIEGERSEPTTNVGSDRLKQNKTMARVIAIFIHIVSTSCEVKHKMTVVLMATVATA